MKRFTPRPVCADAAIGKGKKKFYMLKGGIYNAAETGLYWK